MESEDIKDYENDSPVDADTNSLTKWANEPSLTDLKQDYTEASSDKSSQVSKVNNWLSHLNMTGAAKPKTIVGRSSVAPKLIRKQAEWRYASLSEPFLSTDDVFNIDPVTYEDKEGAQQNALVLNNQFNTKIQKVKFVDEYVRTAVDEGTVFVRVGWEFEEEEQEVEVPEIQYLPTQDPRAIQQLQQIMQAAQQNPQVIDQLPPEMQQAVQMSQQSGQPIMPQQTGVTLETQLVTVKNHPTVEVCDYRRLTIDPSCRGDLKKAGFIIYDFDTSLSELKKDSKYSNLDEIKPESEGVLNLPDDEIDDISAFGFADEPRKKLVVREYWGYWDIDGDGTVKPIVCAWIGDTKIRMEENPYPDRGLPFISAQLLPVRKSVFGEPDGELLIENQKIIGAVTRGMVDVMGRSANGQQGSRKDALDITNKRKFQKGEDYEFNAQVDPKQAFHMHTFPEIPQSAQLMLNLQHSDAESLTGVKAFSSGISGAALGDTATGIRSALDATSKRELGILRRLAEGMKEIGRKIISMNAEFLDEEEVVRVTNDEFVTVRRDDLAGEFDLTLTISTAEADNQKAEELAFMLQTMGPNEDPGLRKILLADITKLRKMPALAKKIEDYEPQPDPLAIKMQELQIALLEAQVETERSKAIENYANAELDKAKAGTEGSKATNYDSITDRNNLDFVEQESGTTQERDLQKTGEQARGNMALRAQDHDMKLKEDAAKPKPTTKAK